MKLKNFFKFTRSLTLVAIISCSAYAENKMIDAIALVVNNEPITVYDIDQRMAKTKEKKAAAVSALIDKKLFDQEIEKKNISADVFDINNYLEKIAASNGMDLYTFKSIVKQKYKDYDAFEEGIKQQVLKDKLAQQLVRGKLAVANDDDLKIYYDNNISQFTTAKTLKVIQYTSKNKRDLQMSQKTPMSNIQSVQKTSIELNQAQLNSQLRYMINNTKENQFTPIFTADKQYVSLFIVKKEGVETLPFEEVKKRIFAVVMQEREKTFLKEYFEKLKLTADIKIVR